MVAAPLRRARVPLRGSVRFLGLALAVALPLALLLRALVPTSTGGGDSEVYRQLAEAPLEPVDSYKNAIFQFRLLVPGLVWLLPLPTNLGFHVVTFSGLVAGAILVAVLARLGGAGRLALLAAPVYLLTFVSFYGLWQYRMIDTVTTALCAGILVAALTQSRFVCALLCAAATASKEHGVLYPLAYYAVGGGLRFNRRMVVQTALVAVPAIAVFVLLRLLVPYDAPYGVRDVLSGWREGFGVAGKWGYGKVFLQTLLQSFGMLWLLWPLGVALATLRWRRLHVFLLVLLPVLAGAAWGRGAMYLVPFVLPSALLVLARGRLALALTALAASAYVSVLMSLRNIGVDPPSFLGSNVGLLPGMAVFVLAAAPAALDALREVARVRADRPAQPGSRPMTGTA